MFLFIKLKISKSYYIIKSKFLFGLLIFMYLFIILNTGVTEQVVASYIIIYV